MPDTDPAVAVVTGSPDNPNPTDKDNQPGASDWTKGFDEGLKKRLEKFKAPQELAKAYVELETMQSKTFQDMTPQEQEKYFKRLGLPESPEGYELSGLTLPDGVADPEVLKRGDAEFKAFAHSLKLTKEQTKGLHEWTMKRATNSILAGRAASKRQAEDSESALRTSWGASFEANQSAVDNVIRMGGDKFVQFMNNGPGKDATIREGLLAISKMFANETFVEGRPPARKAKSEVPEGFVFDPSLSPELANR